MGGAKRSMRASDQTDCDCIEKRIHELETMLEQWQEYCPSEQEKAELQQELGRKKNDLDWIEVSERFNDEIDQIRRETVELQDQIAFLTGKKKAVPNLVDGH